MTKKIINKLVVFLLSAVLVLPLALSLPTVKADEAVNAYPGVEFSFTVSDEVRAKNNAVVITAKDDTLADDKAVELYNNGTTKTDDNKVFLFSSYTSGKVSARITKAGNYTFTVKTIAGENEEVKTFTKSVIVHSSVDNLVAPKYNVSEDAIKAYAKMVEDASYVDANAEVKQSIYVDETYTVPSLIGIPSIDDSDKLLDLVDVGSFSYTQYKRTVYYAAPGGTSYLTSTASGTSNLTFVVSKVGTYRLYVLLSMDEIDGKSFNIKTSGLKEYDDGLYTVYNQSDERIYSSGSKYYKDEEFKEECVIDEDDVKQGELIVPIFEFDVANAGPNVKITSSYQENGYIGLKYKITSVKVSGSEVSTSYTLQYKESEASAWGDATEEFDADDMSFTPEKKGYYRLKIVAIDNEGKTNVVNGEATYTKDIKVDVKYETVDYKTGFNDWISVNYVPFIFLCISGLCLIAIILLLVIKPKEKAESTKVEEDK